MPNRLEASCADGPAETGDEISGKSDRGHRRTLSIVRDASDSCEYYFSREYGRPRIVIHRGLLEVAKTGYLYILAVDDFKQIDAMQWACDHAVKPLARREIMTANYATWVRFEPMSDWPPVLPQDKHLVIDKGFTRQKLVQI